NPGRGEQQQGGPIAKVDRRRRADRIDRSAHVSPRKPRRQMGQTPMRRPWNDGGEILVVVASATQEPEKSSDVRGRRRASGGGRGERQSMLDGVKHMLRCQRAKVMTGVLMAEPIQKTARAQENAIAGLELKTSYPTQIIRKGVQKRSVRIIDYVGRRINESFRCKSAGG